MRATRVLAWVVVAALVAGGRASARESSQDAAPAAASVLRLRVRVVDDGGRPRAGIPVEWRPVLDRRNVNRVAAVSAGPDGIADLGEVTALEGKSGGSPLGIVALDVLAREPTRMLVDLSSFRGEDVVLALPRGDRFDLRVVDAEGHPAALDGSGRAWGEMEEFGVFGFDETRLRGEPRKRGGPSLLVSAGRLEIPFVESGLKVEVLLRLADGSYVTSRYDFVLRESAPIAEVRMPRPGPRIEGRFVLAPHSPIDVTRVDARVELISGHTGVDEKLTPKIAADGRFVIETGGLVDDFNDLRVGFLDPIGSVIGLWHYSYARGDAVSISVGDVAIADRVPIASGRVVDDVGKSIAGAELHVVPDYVGGRIPREAQARINDLHWFASRSAADGSFVASAPFEVSRCSIAGSAVGHRSGKTSTIVKPDNENVTLVLPRLGTVVGRLLLPGSTNVDGFTARLSMTETVDADGNESAVDPVNDTNDVVRGDVGRDGSLKFQDVEPGVHTLWMSFRSTAGDETRQAHRIIVKSGAETTVAPIDLDATRFPREVVVLPVVATTGAARRLVTTWKLYSILSDGRRGRSIDSDVVPVVQGVSAPMVDLVAPGFRPKRFTCEDDPQVVDLEPGAPLTIHVVPPPRPGAARVVVLPIAATGDRLLEEAVHAEVDDQGTALVRVGESGACDVLLFQRPSPESSTVEWDQVAAHRKAIVVADSMAPQEFRLEWKPR